MPISRRAVHFVLLSFALTLALLPSASLQAERASAGPSRIEVLFLGDNGPHKPAERIAQVLAPLAEQGINLTYTDELSSLDPSRLRHYHAVMIYSNHMKIAPSQEKALLDFVAAGGGLIAVHCASFCFHNSPAYIELVGAQFKTHGAGIFKTRIKEPGHPALRDVGEIESWDETYVHDKHNPDRIVLEERVEGDHVEPWTWVRTHGKGRVFYTAWGHDHRTWSHKGFVQLLAGGTRWAASKEGEKWVSPDHRFEYVNAQIPNYLAGERWGTIGQPISKMQKPLSPEQSMKHIVVPPDFELKLYASEPQLAKPVAMTWDERGRLWLAETVDYPNDMQPPGQGNDRIRICEDTDGDGMADKFTIFADRLSIPTGLVLANGGLIVSQAPDMLFFKDTDGDDVADERKVLFTGFGTFDTHAGPSNLRYGFDNWIWATIGYSGFEGQIAGKTHRFRQGLFRFKPDGSELEFLGSTSNNTWGLGFEETGEVFASTANNDHAVYMALPNRVYESVRGWSGSGTMGIADHRKFHPVTSKVRQMDWHGGFTAAAGHGLYTARAFPEWYWNRIAFVTEPTGHLVHQNVLQPFGSGYIARDGFNLLAGAEDEWVSPIMAETGPDGAVWVLDWYNFIIQHNPTPPGFQTGKGNAYVTPLRDKTHARIYRVLHRDGHHAQPEPLTPNDAEGLIAGLQAKSLTHRLSAQRLLVERGQADVFDALVRLIADTNLDEIGSNPAALHALWVLDGLGAFATRDQRLNAAVRSAISHPAAGVRKTAAAIIERHPDILANAFDLRLIEDKNPLVRRQALVTLSRLREVEGVGPLLLAAMQRPDNSTDRWISEAAIAAAAGHGAEFIETVLAASRHANAPQDDQAARVNLIPNHSFEQTSGKDVRGWQSRDWQGQAEFAFAPFGRTGEKAVAIRSATGADSSWSTIVPVQPRTQYRLSGWVRTEALDRGSSHGALLNIHEIQNPPARTPSVSGTTDWTKVEVVFNSGPLTHVTVNCLFGGWGKSRGTAYFDDVELALEPTESTGLGDWADRATRVVTTHYVQDLQGESVFKVLKQLPGAQPTLSRSLLDGLLQGWADQPAPSASAEQWSSLVAAYQSVDTSIQARLALLMSRWNQNEAVAEIRSHCIKSFSRELADGSLDSAARSTAARWLIRLTGDAKPVLQQVSTQTPPELAQALLETLVESRDDATATALIHEKWGTLTPSSRRAVINVLLRRPAWTSTLLKSVESGLLLQGDIPIEYWPQLTQHGDPALAALARKLRASNTNADMQKLVESYAPVMKMKGDASRGRQLYADNCAVCHQFAGAGGRIGPALDGIGARPRDEVIIAILDPNRSVEANYRLWIVTTKDGRVISGRLETESQTAISLLDLTGAPHVVQRSDIQSLLAAPVSLMPIGFERLEHQGMADLLEYLSHHE